METTYDDWKIRICGIQSIDRRYLLHSTWNVTGIIAGQGENKTDYAMTGVAPDEDIYAYRVLGQYGSGTTEAF
ncbi:hypothetical protein [Cytobacillus pseudoceanisediminis]|uniref:hypothetical protein n=1 Tax=Cytobacillus pseudoceanisediminis TaxID=3051614 RepID=UPI003C2BB12B